MDASKHHPGYRLPESPEPPDTLSQGARAEWQAILPVIYELRTGRGADLRLLELLCELLADIRSLEAKIRLEGYTVTSSGGPKPHPALRSLESARRQAQNLLDKFGLAGYGGHQAPKFYKANHSSRFG